MDADLKQILSFVLCTTLYKARFTNALSQYSTDEFSAVLYIPVTVLHIKCIFSQWMQAPPRKREQVLLLWRRCVIRPFVLYNDSYSDSYLSLTANISVHGQNQHRDFCEIIYI